VNNDTIAKRLRASVRMDAINGDATERSVCGRQMMEAADALDRYLERETMLGECAELLTRIEMGMHFNPESALGMEVHSLARRLSAGKGGA
jgi:hypothetical protein